MNYILKYILLLFISTTVLAQVNIEKYKSINEEDGVFGNMGFYISSKTGNTDIQELGIDGRVSYNTENFNTFLIGQGEYGWNKGKEFSNNALLHLRLMRITNSVFYPEAFAQINYNKKQLLLFRSLAGAGLRINLINDSTNTLSFGTAYMFETENLDLSINAKHNSYKENHRWSNYVSYSNSFTENSHISVIVYAQPKLDEFSDIRLLSENHFSVDVNKNFAVSISFNLRYDSKPPDSVKDLDTTTKVGFAFNF